MDDSSLEIPQFAAFVIFFTYWSNPFKGSRNCPNRFGQFQNNFGPIEGQDISTILQKMYGRSQVIPAAKKFYRKEIEKL